jgi:integrase
LRNLHTKTYIKNGQNFKYKKDTIDKYKYFVDDLIAFEINLGKKIKVIDVDDHLNNEFISFLRDFKGQFPNTIGRTVKRLKTLIKDAEMNGKRVNIRYRLIKGFEDETIVTFLTLEEINKIINTQMPTPRMELAKEWMIIGCFTAQRISDLFRLESSMIAYENNIPFIYLKQYKTEKKVKVPVHYKVEEILKKYNLGFPPNFSSNEKSNRTILSELIKEVCKISGINEVVRGRFDGAVGHYPKHQLISNHTLRRSFASNFYGMEGWNTPMVMEITGHSTEKNFYKYVDKDNFTLSEKAALNFAKMKNDES